MAKKQTGESIRVPADLARKARVVASARGMSLPEYLIEKLTPIVQEDLLQVPRLMGLGEEQKPEK